MASDPNPSGTSSTPTSSLSVDFTHAPDPPKLSFPEPSAASFQNAARSLQDPGRSAFDKLVPDLRSVVDTTHSAVDGVAQHIAENPLGFVEEVATVTEIAKAIGSRGVHGGPAYLAEEGMAWKLAVGQMADTAMKSTEGVHGFWPESMTADEAKSDGYKVDHGYASKDGVRWWLLKRAPAGMFGIAGLLNYFLGMLIVALGILLVAMTPYCGAHKAPYDPNNTTFAVPSLPSTTARPVPPRGAESTPGNVTPGVTPNTVSDTTDGWEINLKHQRDAAADRGDMSKYNSLLSEHLKIYRERGVDPCQSPYIPQGCR